MKRFSAVLFVLLPLPLFAQNYAQTITFANMDSASNKVANLQSCFGTDGTALFDELYILGRTWQEKQWDNYYSTTSISLADFDALPAEEKELPANVDYVPDVDGAWVVGTINQYKYLEIKVRERQVYRKLSIKCSWWPSGYERVDDVVIGVPVEHVVLEPTKPDKKWVTPNVDEGSDTWWLSNENSSENCKEKEYNDKIREYIKYVWVNPDGSQSASETAPIFKTVYGDTIGVLVQRKNAVQFNTSSGRGELIPYNSAIERISATETVTVPGALGAYNERQGEWHVDNVKDNVFLNGEADTIYTVMSYLSNGTFTYNNTPYTYASFKQKVNGVPSYKAKMWEYNNLPQKREGTAQFRTPCYVYKKSGNSYVFERVFDATKECIGKVTTAGKKIYLTGRCISFNAKNPATNQSGTFATQASVGYDGPGFITIDCSGTTDLYIEDLELQTKTPVNTAEQVIGVFDVLGSQPIAERISAPIVLQTKNNTTNIHIRGRNLLMGAPGRNLKVDAVVASKSAAMHGAAVYMNNNKDAMTCNFDDKWPVSANSTETVSTNGFLKLVGEQDQYFGTVGRAHRQASPIYLGNDNCIVVFDGGEYRFTPADATEGATTNNMIAAMRQFEEVGQVVTNVGSCTGVGTVHFKSGTFSMTALVGNPTPILPVSDGTNLMRVPAKSIIDGGTFNGCVVRRCGDYTSNNITCPKNTDGNDLFEFKITGDLNSEGYLDKLDLPTNEGYDYGYYNFTHCLPLLDENGDYYYSPYLPSNQRSCGVISVIQNWDVGFPSGLSSYMEGDERELYMNTKTDANYLSTKYFAMLELNPYYPSASAENNYTNSHITETDDYAITDNVYLMTWCMSDKWRIITAPFDVSDVYVLETWATADNGVTADPDKEFQYFILTAQQLVIKGSLNKLDVSVGANNDFFGIYNSAVATTEAQVSEDDWRVAKKPYKMTYWREDGTDTRANYYLYEAVGINEDAKAIGLGSQFERVWEAVPRHDKDGNSIIMEKGKTYAIMFPNWVSEGESGWNYWHGKYILFEGPGQTLSGTGSFRDVTAPDNDNEFQFGGNPTFGFVEPEQSYIYTWDFEQQEFVRGTKKQMSWLDSYMVANDATTRQLAKIGRRGNPSYDTSTDNRLQGATPLVLDVYEGSGAMRLYAYMDQQINIIDMTGRLVSSFDMSSNSLQEVQLSTGVYVVRSSQMQQPLKVMVK